MQQAVKCIFLCFILSALAACHSHDIEPEISQHTLLIYICGDNSLSNLADQNIQACCDGLLNCEDPLNLIIYKDNYGNRGRDGYQPSLFQLRLSANKSRIDTVYLQKWNTDPDSSDPALFAEVVTTVFNRFDTQIKGLEMWGHGRSWIPGSSWDPNAGSRAAQFACVDSLNYMEVWEMSDALDRTGVHFDYILFDACFMGTAEVAYELRNNCDWLIGSPCEIPSKGFPYTKNIEYLSEVTGKAGEPSYKLSQMLSRCIDNFERCYPDKSALSLFDEHQMEALHNAYKQLTADYASFYSDVADNPYAYEAEMVHYGRSASGDRYHFYDLADFAKISGGSLDDRLSQVVKRHFTAAQYYDGAGTVTFDHSCGMAITPPQLFSLSEQRERLTAAYSRLKWSR